MFGTDGIRGIVGEKITPMLFFGLGLAISEVFGGTAVVARDTRKSGEELFVALSDGLTAGGVNVIYGGIAPSPALSKAVANFGADFGIMITASHNPPQYNGIKLFDRFGCKITRDKERLVEFYFTHPPARKYCKGKKSEGDFLSAYAEGLGNRFDKSVTIDFGFGAGCALKAFLDARAFNDTPSGENINVGCGAICPEFIRSVSRAGWGFALDGDADRLAVVYDGEPLDGDSVLYNLALSCGCDKVVTTVMSNSALICALKEKGIETELTPVGDKFVGERMRQIGCELGGEQSGHYILGDRNCTGDALGAAAQLFAEFSDSKPVKLDLYPQISFDYPKYIAAKQGFDAGVAALRANFDGRLVFRLSGTEPKARFMAEHHSQKTLREFTDTLKAFLDTLL